MIWKYKTMLIEPYIEQSYPKTAPLKGINEIEDELINQRFFIVMEESDKYVGMLTVADVLARKKKLVADCLLPKPCISPDSTIDQAMKLLSSTNLPALPVIDSQQKFYGVLSQEKLIGTFQKWQCEKKSQEEKENSSPERIKQEFIRNISHEIRTPLNAIQGLSEILIYSDISNVDKENFAALLHAKTDELLQLVDSLLHLSKIESEESIPKSQSDVEPDPLFREILVQARKTLTNYKKEHLHISYSMNLPENHRFKTNLPYLKEVMTHLVNNAIKFTDEGSVIFGSHLDEEGKTVFYVKDTGVGIPPEKQKIIFKAFEKGAPNNSKFYPGIGVGLTIASKIVELSGGKIWFESEINKGTSFYFSI
ncbi:MAG: hypothetical protein PWQ17_2277 [Anaerophaga sp.]|nr:hypothetical protein [Anaerophaga sp.]